MRALKSPCALAVLAVLLVLPAGALAGQERPHLSSDPRVNGARALIEDGRFDAALSILRPLAQDHPDRTDVLFLIGLAATRASQRPHIGEDERTALLGEAIASLRTILVDRPGLVRVRLELARAFFLEGEDDLSREHFERVLAGRPRPAMAANIRRFLNAIQARRRWNRHFGIAIAPDSNLDASSEADILYIHGLPFRRDADAEVRSGLGVVLWGGGEYQHPLGGRLRLRLGADIARREYGGRRSDQTFVAAHAGPRWMAGAATELSVLGSARRRRVAGKSDYRELGTRAEMNHRFAPRLTARGRVSWHQRRYPASEWLDGPNSALSLGGAWLITSTVRGDVTAGYMRERPQSLVWRNASRWVRLGTSISLPLGFTVGVGGELYRTTYEGRWFPFTPDGAAREDRTRILRVSVFNRAYTVYGFSPQLVLVNEARESNAQLHDYDRTRAELRFVRQF